MIIDREGMEAVFWPNVDDRDLDGCWPWRGPKRASGYGVIYAGNNVRLSAHRVSYELHHGIASEDILHTCGNPSCVNPAHLRAGTHKENMRDRSLHGRHGLARMTPETVRELRRLRAAGWQQRDLAKKFNIHQTTVSQILRGVTWTHV